MTPPATPAQPTSPLVKSRGSTFVGEALLSLPPEQFPSVMPLLPDTAWTTTALHVLSRKQGRVRVDTSATPQCLIVIAAGDPALRTLDRAFLFGTATSEAMKSFVRDVKTPTELVCDQSAADLVRKTHPTARMRESIVYSFARLEDAHAIESTPGAKRLRISDAESIATLVPPIALRTFRSVRELVTGGSAFVVQEEGAVIAAAFSVDHSSKHERILVATQEARRKQGHGTMVGRRLVKSIAEQGRIPCAVVDRSDLAGVALAEKLGFNHKMQILTFTTRLQSI